jgi:hypothetical protein
VLRSRGISEGILYVYNPLPKVTEDTLLDAAGLTGLFQGSRRSPFEWIWKYGSGLQTETVEIKPGEFLPLRESEATEFERASNALEMGLCIVRVNDPAHAETKKQAVLALNRAIRFYHDGGQKQLIDQRKRHAYSEADMEEQKSRFYAYFLNRAKELAIREHLKAVQSPAKTGTKAA